MCNKKQWVKIVINILIGGGLFTHFNPGNLIVLFNHLNH